MHPHARLITDFYTAFQRRDGAAMAACYAPDARFSDPVFPDLQGPQVGAMWRMLTQQGKDLELSFSEVQADDAGGTAHWEADYTFSRTGRKVHNVIDARFTFRDGLISSHEDRFDLYAWTRMALGPVGLLMGWTPMVQGKLRGEAAKGLARFMEKEIET